MPSPIRVVHFVWGGGSGSTKVVMDLIEGHLRSKVFEPLMVLRVEPQKNQGLFDELQKRKINFKIVPKKPKHQMMQGLTGIINEFKPEIMVAHGYREHIYGRQAAINQNVPVIFQVEHNIDQYKLSPYLQSRRLEKRTNKIICVSRGVKEHLIKLGFNENKTKVIYNAVDLDKFRTVNTPFASRVSGVIMVARFSPQKDHLTLIKAAKILKEMGKPVKVALVGEGKTRKSMERLCHKWGLVDNISFLGSRADVPQLLAKYQIFVLSTHYEGFGLVVVEAMAAGCLAVASKVPGVSEIIKNGETGYLVPPSDPQALAEILRKALDNPNQAELLANRGQHYAIDNFQLDRMVKEYEELFLNELHHCYEN